MTLSLAPPPLEVPPDFALDKIKAGFFNGLINTIYQLWTAVYGIRAQSKIKTTDAASTGMLRVQTDTDKSYMIVANIVARRTGGSAGSVGDTAWYTLTGGYKNIGGALSAVGTASLVGGEDQASWNVGFNVSGIELAVIVQGAANNDITWEGSISTFVVGS